MKSKKEHTVERVIQKLLTEAANVSFRPGEIVLIGFEGTRDKFFTTIKSIDQKTGNYYDENGNVYNPSGRLIRRSNHPKFRGHPFGSHYASIRDPGNRNVQLEPYTQKEYEQRTRNVFKGYISQVDVNKLSFETILQLQDILGVRFSVPKPNRGD